MNVGQLLDQDMTKEAGRFNALESVLKRMNWGKAGTRINESNLANMLGLDHGRSFRNYQKTLDGLTPQQLRESFFGPDMFKHLDLPKTVSKNI